MNPILLIILGWLAVGLESGLKGIFAVRAGSIVGAPSFVVPVVVMVAICAPPSAALWTALVLGLLCDLTAPVAATTNTTIYHIGPGAIGLVLGAQFVLLVRGFVIRRNPLTLVVLSIAAGVIAAICTVAIITVRQWIWSDPIEWGARHEILSRLFSAVLTGGSALVMSVLLLPLTPMLGLHQGQGLMKMRR